MEHPALSLIVPTLNEAPNVTALFRRLKRCLRTVSHEILIVDDASMDGTPDLAELEARSYPSAVRVIRRRTRPGLSASILAGFKEANGRRLAVMDADLQHDPRVLPALVVATDSADIAVGSRYAFRGRTCGWSLLREAQSRLAAAVTRWALGLRVLDPLSGFFCVRHELFERIGPVLEARGWKLLLEILALARDARVAEVPFTFRARVRGKTKMNAAVVRSWLSELGRLRRIAVARPRPFATLSKVS